MSAKEPDAMMDLLSKGTEPSEKYQGRLTQFEAYALERFEDILKTRPLTADEADRYAQFSVKAIPSLFQKPEYVEDLINRVTRRKPWQTAP